jgi:hypothetical protein
VDVSILNKEDVSTNLNSFIDFSKDILGRKGYVEDVKFDMSTHGDTTEIQMNITLKLENSFIEDRFIINRTVYS